MTRRLSWPLSAVRSTCCASPWDAACWANVSVPSERLCGESDPLVSGCVRQWWHFAKAREVKSLQPRFPKWTTVGMSLNSADTKTQSTMT